MSKPIRVLIVDEHLMFRQALKVVLESSGDIETVGEAKDGADALALAEQRSPDVILLDALRNGDGAAATRAIRERFAATKVLMLSGSPDEDVLAEAIEAGASGYITKESALKDLVDATRAVARGEVLIPPGMLGGLLGRLIRHRRNEEEGLQREAKLTARERQVLALLARGENNDGIARELVMSPETARTHIQNILAKLGVHSRVEAAAFALRHGPVDVGAGS